MKGDVPKWISEIEQGTDAASLSAGQQMLLTLFDYTMKSGADISKVLSGDQELVDFWLDSHWAGKDKDKVARRESFVRNYEIFKALNK